MSDHDGVISNDTGAAVRADINLLSQAILNGFSGASAPAAPVAYQHWHDTSNGLLKQRNAANSGWLVRGNIAETFVLARSSNTILAAADFGRIFNCTSSFTQTLTAAATLGDGWCAQIRNNGVGVITIDPNSSETIDGATTLVLLPGDACLVLCNGTAFTTQGLSSQDRFKFDASVGSNILTVTLKAGSVINFRDATATVGTPTPLRLAADVSVAVSSGSTLGFTASQKSRIYVGAMNNSGALEPLVYHANGGTSVKGFNEDDLISTTAEGGAGAADSAQVAYSTTGRATLPWRMIGWIEITTGGTPGQWGSAPAKVQPMMPGVRRHGDIVQCVYNTAAGGSSTASTLAVDVTGGSVVISPTSDINKVEVDFSWNGDIANLAATNVQYSSQVLRGATNLAGADSHANDADSGAGGNGAHCHFSFAYIDNPLSTAAQTYKVQHRTSNASVSSTTAAFFGKLKEVFV